MSHERLEPPIPAPDEGFGFTEHEQLYHRVPETRFRAWLDDDQTTIHRVEVSSNSYGSFLFVTLSRAHDARRECVTLYGLGFHEYRERWFTREWFW